MPHLGFRFVVLVCWPFRDCEPFVFLRFDPGHFPSHCRSHHRCLVVAADFSQSQPRADGIKQRRKKVKTLIWIKMTIHKKTWAFYLKKELQTGSRASCPALCPFLLWLDSSTSSIDNLRHFFLRVKAIVPWVTKNSPNIR